MQPKDPSPPIDASGRRQDFRLAADESSPLVADCLTASGRFRERVRNVSSKGAFLATTRSLRIGEEIAMVIPLAGSKTSIKATGEVVRAEDAGYGIEFRVIFRH
jgi:c-di-GMP-binding flagellar brake protein YcgR